MIESALILAAGLGTRLKPLTLERPKPLVEVGTVPLVEIAISYARAAGAKQICLNTHHLHPALEDALSSNADLRFSYEPKVLGTGGGLRVMWEKLGAPDGPVLVMNADALIDIDLEAMAKVHRDSGAVATLAVKDAPDKAKFGLLGSDDDDQIFGFAGRTKFEGPFHKERMFCGVHLAERALFERLPRSFSGVNEIGYPPLIDEGARVQAFGFDGYFCDVGTPERLLEANRDVLAGRLTRGPNFVAVHRSAKLGEGVELVDSSVGANAVIEDGARLRNVCVQSGAWVEAGAVLEDLVVYPGGRIDA